MLPILSTVALTVGLYVTAGFIISLIIKRNDIADIMWGPGIALVAWSAIGFDIATTTLLQQFITILISIWALRLALRIFNKNRHKEEDSRYKRWRDAWGIWFYPRSFLQVFLLQGFLMILVGYSAIHAAAFAGTYTMPVWLYIGVSVWLLGFFFELVGDYQLDRFLKNPANHGRLMKYGLWRYSRHPNYFGEITMWWGIWICVIPVAFSTWALISPLTITTLILFVSGIPLLEASLKRHPEFSEYARRTSVLIPRPPRA